MVEIKGEIGSIKKYILNEMSEAFSDKFSLDFIDEKFAEIISVFSSGINKEVMAIINRKGIVLEVFVGEGSSVLFDVSSLKEKNIRGIHTHLNGSSRLSDEDKSALDQTNLEAIVAIGILENKIVEVSTGYLSQREIVEKIYNNISLANNDNIFELIDFDTKTQSNLINTTEKREKAILVGCEESSLDELASLADTAGADVVDRIMYNPKSHSSKYLVGSGKLGEIRGDIQKAYANVVIFDEELNGSQLRNVQEYLMCKVVDRTILILDIFAARAQTREGKLQVHLAQLKYRSTHLVGTGHYLSRLGGGIGTRGPGETKLESDRRHLRSRINTIEKQISQIQKRRDTTRESREKNNIDTVALVGYTNAGKSSLSNLLTDSNIYVENKLFATLDPTTRKMKLPSGKDILISDTVGFVKKLPHELVESFKSTLEEIVFSNLIVIVLDASDINMMKHMEVIFDLFSQLNIKDKKIVLALNKIDKIKKDFDRRIYKYRDEVEKIVYISVLNNKNIDLLKKHIDEILFENEIVIEKIIPYKDAKEISYYHENARIIEEEYRDDGIFIKAIVKEKSIER